MLKKVFTVFFMMVCFCFVQAQELEYSIRVTAPQTQLADPKTFRNLETNLIELLNTRRWTQDMFEPGERIKVNVQINIRKELSEIAFDAELTIQASRPVYGTTYETIIFNHVDREFSFAFDDSRPLVYSDNIYTDNLTQVFAFYSFIILGLDYDSFSPYGGDMFFQLAQEVVSVVPISDAFAAGWRANDSSRSRHSLITNIMNPRIRPFRKAFYDYHRLGLDLMHKDPEAGKTSIMAALEELDKVNKAEPNTTLLQVFAVSKNTELVDIFLPMPMNEKQRVYAIMTGIDPSSAARMNELRR